jgi:hypothetical protein
VTPSDCGIVPHGYSRWREGLDVGTWRFLRLGAVVMPPALVLAIMALGAL